MKNIHKSLIFSFLFFANIATAAIIHIPEEQPTLQAGIDVAENGDTVLAADGIYRGNGNKNLMYNGKWIVVMSKNGARRSIIDCEHEGRGVNFINNEGHDSVLRGFTIKNGNYELSGGGINCSGASPTIVNCIISDNSARFKGGGIRFQHSQAVVSNCLIIGNRANFCGGIYCTESSPSIINCSFINNTTNLSGGALSCFRSSPTLTNCTIVDNYAGTGGGVHSWNESAPNLINCILWGNTAISGNEIAIIHQASINVSYCDVKGGESGVYSEPGSSLIWGPGNMEADPLFISGPLGDYYLSRTAAGQPVDSPCLDAGNMSAADICFEDIEGIVCLNELTTRIDGVPDEGAVNLGFHYNIVVYTPTTSPTATYPPTITPHYSATPTPSAIPTQTLTPFYSPTGTPVSSAFRVRFDMPSDHYCIGDECWLNVHIYNYDIPLQNVPLFVLMDISSHYWFWDDWSYMEDHIDYNLIDIGLGKTIVPIIEPFDWPDTSGFEMKGLAFWSAVTDRDFTYAYGGEDGIGNCAFGFGEEPGCCHVRFQFN